MVKIAVLGAGINGLACALKIKEKYKNFDVVIITEQQSPHTTGDGSGGLWYPYLCGNTPADLLKKWGGETYRYLHELWLSGGHDVCAMPVYVLHRETKDLERPEWVDSVFGYHPLSVRELGYLSDLHSIQYRAGHSFTTFVSSPPSILGQLSRQFIALGGRIVDNKVTSLDMPLLRHYDVIVNCTGMGARGLIGDDAVKPIRGQIIKVEAPWLNAVIVDEDSGHYVIPNVRVCVLGGTHQEGDFNTTPDAGDEAFITEGCHTMLPGLQHAQVVSRWVGLRPGRERVRLEPERSRGKLYIHNYGHGGSGLSLFWGCATDVLGILDTHLNENSAIKSKL